MRPYHSLLLLAVGLASCTPAEKKPAEDPHIQQVESNLIPPVRIVGDSIWTIAERMKHYGVPGVSMAVIVDGKIAWTRTYGITDKETNAPVTDTTLFQAGSISKPVAAYGALKAVDLGKINGDQNVNDYLTSWKIPENAFTKEKKVTLKQLLSHSAGLTVHGFPGYSPDQPVPSLVQVLNGEAPANTPAIFVDKKPGENFRYSGGGYTVMQQMLIDIEGKPFPEILDGWVLRPLGMTHSTYTQPLTGRQLSMAATGYLPDGSQTKGKRHTYPEMAAAGLWTTAEDLARFAIDVQQTYAGRSSAVLSQATVRQMLTPYTDDFNGLGLFIDKMKDDVYFQHGGWDEGFSSQLMAHRDKGYGVVVLTNSNHPDFIDELIRAVAFTYQWDNYMPTYEKMEVTAANIAAVTGRYLNGNDGLISLYARGGKLYVKYIRGKEQELFKVTDSTYVVRDNLRQLQIKRNPADQKWHIVMVSSDGESSPWERPRLEADKKIPYEFLLAGDFDQARKAYEALKKANPDDGAIREEKINSDGYDLMGKKQYKLAQDVFKINMLLYPKSSNVYDSYAEACMKMGDLTLAVENYKKSLAMDPKNTGAVKKLEELAAMMKK
ncbi:MAG: serine hydrolase [Cytophagales bacterium]|nr:serine hydrolase [Cytophagales bacterium]